MEHDHKSIGIRDQKWFPRTVVADAIIEKLKSLKLSYPTVSEAQMQHLLEAKELLENEPS